ncbi:MAG: hypothetical protein ACRD9Q_06680 [Nitrososphaeraceae archaeon]
MTYYIVEDIKNLLGEKGQTNDQKVKLYGEMADAFINTDLISVEETVPLTTVPDVIRKISNLLAVSYFFKFESGDLLTAVSAEELWGRYFIAQYKRPKVIASVGV